MENKDLIPIDIYKDPLKKNEGGFGFLGCLMQTPEKDKLQCHICGELHAYLAHHIRIHKLTSKGYREKYGLTPNSSLLSESARTKAIETFMKIPLEKRLEWVRIGQLKSAEARKEGKIGHGKKITLEDKNKRGSCPDQVIEEIKNFSVELGRTPTQKDFIVEHPMKSRYYNLAIRTFGSYSNALKKAGLPPNKPGDFRGNSHKKWDRETLIELLQVFAKENNRIPTNSDCYRGYLPSRSVFHKYFGGMENARVEAGLYNL